ncbi:DUF4845 domain-containing protein [Rhodanobacter sp. 7MK24]|uniref:DUF4845 domain-containing protein n=1 Tax=Rhodanobacter sp. 7MK24 TaxID=2775922 RepID=UPI00177FCD85|nr:DUF4845 domain-containing protein [Rhodanobacter sp. 7MK24]MBD8880925.1 DUF4845 domain-containing protein [Rhodanobacter sp. 7MK24]
MKTKQSGVTLIGFLVILLIVGFFGFMAMKLVPAYTEYAGAVKAMDGIASSSTNGKSLGEIRSELLRKMSFQYVDDATVKPTDITITRDNGGGSSLNVSYDKDIPFIYNIDFLLHFQKSVRLQGNVNE